MAVAAAIIGVVLLINKTQQPALPKTIITDGVACLTEMKYTITCGNIATEFEEQDIKKLYCLRWKQTRGWIIIATMPTQTLNRMIWLPIFLIKL